MASLCRSMSREKQHGYGNCHADENYHRENTFE